MSASPHIIEFDYPCMRNVDAAHVYERLLDVYAGITLGMLQRSICAFRFAYDEFQDRFGRQLDGHTADDIRRLDIRRGDLLAELSRLVSVGEADADPAVQIAARHMRRILGGVQAPAAPDARTRTVAVTLAALTAARTAHFLGRLPPARDLVKRIAEANDAYARLCDSCITHHLRAEVDDNARAMAVKVNSCIDILEDSALAATALAANAVLAAAVRDADYCLAPPSAEPDEISDGDSAGADGGEADSELSLFARRRIKNRKIRQRSGAAVTAESGIED